MIEEPKITDLRLKKVINLLRDKFTEIPINDFVKNNLSSINSADDNDLLDQLWRDFCFVLINILEKSIIYSHYNAYQKTEIRKNIISTLFIIETVDYRSNKVEIRTLQRYVTYREEKIDFLDFNAPGTYSSIGLEDVVFKILRHIILSFTSCVDDENCPSKHAEATIFSLMNIVKIIGGGPFFIDITLEFVVEKISSMYVLYMRNR